MIADHSYPTGKQIKLSIGVAMVLAEDKNEEEAVRRAGSALYQAKEAGRNAVRFC